VSSICLNLPAAGLGPRPPSVVSSLADEGGFNEPSPEIKAKLKPAYNFENLPPLSPTHNNAYENPDYVEVQETKAEIITKATVGHEPVLNDQLNYIDVGYRIRPEGTEAPAVYADDEPYRPSIKNSVLEEMEHEEQLKIHSRSQATVAVQRTNGVVSHVTQVSDTIIEANEKVVYATIKPEPPPMELILDAEKDEAKFLDFEEKTETEKGYHSPQTILDPTRPTLAEREEFDDVDDDEADDFDDDDVRMICNKPLPPEPPISRPQTIPEDSTLDLHDVEYADASDNDGEISLPDAMTADEAERLLSSR
jgi:neurabin